MLKITFIWEGRKFGGSLVAQDSLAWYIVYMTFSVSVDILIFLGREDQTQNDHVYPACSDFRKCIFSSFVQVLIKVTYILEENSPFCRHIP